MRLALEALALDRNHYLSTSKSALLSVEVHEAQVGADMLVSLRKGEAAGIGWLYDLCAADIYGLAQTMLGDPERAEEVVGKTMRKMLTYLQSGQEVPSDLRLWALRLGRALCVDVLRLGLVEQGEVEGVKPGSGYGDGLSAEDQMLYEMIYLKARPVGEVAARLGMTVGAVMVRFRQILKQLSSVNS